MQEIKCRWAPSLGELEASAEEVWGTTPYNKETDKDKPCVFFGLYGMNDFYDLWNHRGKKWILWAGSDIRHFKAGYWLDHEGDIRVSKEGFAKWIAINCESFVENEVEQWALRAEGIEAKIVPSFLGDVSKFKLTWPAYEKPRLYTSVSGDNFELYGWDRVVELADRNPEIEFHFYGNTRPFGTLRESTVPNVIVHGRVPKEQMNAEIKDMQGAIRMTEFDGASEIIVKAMLMGKYAFSLIPYPGVFGVDKLSLLKSLKEPNIEGRNWWLKNLNQFPWNKYAERNIQKDKASVEQNEHL